MAPNEAVWIDECAVCAETFSQPRKPGARRKFCSDECRTLRGRRGEMRLDKASKGTGVTPCLSSERHSKTDPARHSRTEKLKHRGLTETQRQTLAETFGAAGFQSEQYVKAQTRRALARERQRAGSGMCVSDRWSLPATRDEGRTGSRRLRVIGQADVGADWQNPS